MIQSWPKVDSLPTLLTAGPLLLEGSLQSCKKMEVFLVLGRETAVEEKPECDGAQWWYRMKPSSPEAERQSEGSTKAKILL